MPQDNVDDMFDEDNFDYDDESEEWKNFSNLI